MRNPPFAQHERAGVDAGTRDLVRRPLRATCLAPPRTEATRPQPPGSPSVTGAASVQAGHMANRPAVLLRPPILTLIACGCKPRSADVGVFGVQTLGVGRHSSCLDEHGFRGGRGLLTPGVGWAAFFCP